MCGSTAADDGDANIIPKKQKAENEYFSSMTEVLQNHVIFQSFEKLTFEIKLLISLILKGISALSPPGRIAGRYIYIL